TNIHTLDRLNLNLRRPLKKFQLVRRNVESWTFISHNAKPCLRICREYRPQRRFYHLKVSETTAISRPADNRRIAERTALEWDKTHGIDGGRQDRDISVPSAKVFR